ncbi:enoyl-CoA hydratase/isomerase family protein [Streptomyces umbrinus]|uniref:enoyl-CoA hydratase/isomerase family protein n=1 Tax=Streptomyces umbrinus TaxID=67370 RepID=UPI003C2C8B4B
MDGEVQLEFVEKVAYVRLNRPEALNAFSHALVRALSDALDAIDAHEDCRVIVISGNGRAFSAGGDLKEFRRRLTGSGRDDLTEFVHFVADTLTRIAHNPRPVIAAVGGLAVAGGLELILCCDIVLAAHDVLIGDGHLRYGVLPGGGGAARLIRKLPPNVAARLLLTGEMLPADYLREQGLVNEVLEPSALSTRAAQLAEHMAQLSPLAISQVKHVAREAAQRPMADGLRLELEAFAGYIGSPDFLEGITAFSQRREPVFQPMERVEGSDE